MRFAHIYLRAYGRFTAQVLTFPCLPEGDLQLVFGANEAGKSTTLSAATDFLFGFDKPAYDFQHGLKELRVGASLQLAGGELHAMRRRGRKQTLFALDPVSQEEDTRMPLADDVLAATLSGLDRTTYRMLFGLDLDALVEGGEALAAGEGEVGQSLFQAAAGLSVLKQVGVDLAACADQLFKRTGKTLPLNKAIAAYTAQGKTVREISVRSSEWEAADERRQKTNLHHRRVLAQLRQARDEAEKLGRIRGNLPDLVRRKALLEALLPLRDAPRLAPNAVQRRQSAEEDRRAARRAEQAAVQELQRLAKARADITVDTALLSVAEGVERLNRRIEAFVQARETRARDAGTLAAARLRLRAILDEIAPGTAEGDATRLLPSPALQAGVKNLLEQRPGLDADLEHCRGQRDKTQAELAKARAKRAALPQRDAPADLAPAIEALEEYPPLEERLQHEAMQLHAARAKLQREAAQIGRDDAQALVRLRVPSRAEVLSFQIEFSRLDGLRAELSRKRNALAADQQSCAREIQGLEAAGDVVTPLQVRQSRAHRDRLWKVVRRLFVDGDAAARAAAATYGTDEALPEALECSTHEADRLADRLHADTERATQYAGRMQRKYDLARQGATLAVAMAGLDAEVETLRVRWAAECAPLGLGDPSPRAVAEWMPERARVVAEFERLAAQETAYAADLARQEALARDLAHVIERCGLPGRAGGESAAFVLRRVRQHHEAVRAAAAEHERLGGVMLELDAEVQRLQAACERAGEALAQWNERWSDAVARLHLRSTLERAAVKLRLEEFERLKKLIDEVRHAERREAEQTEILTSFERSVAELSAELARPSDGAPPELWVSVLHEALAEARRASDRSMQMEQSMRREEEKQRDARQDLDSAQDRLAAMACEAHCDVAALADVHARAAERLKFESELEQVDQALIERNARAVEDLEREAMAYDADSIRQALVRLSEQSAQLDEDEVAARDARSEALRAFAAIDGSAAAAELQQQQVETGAQIQAHANRWSRARLAAAILQRVVQQHRERHQGPLLDRASAIFAAITCGSFARLTTDYADDRQILQGERRGGERIAVGAMSKGTRDQLYLALRLATIESHLASRGALPVIVDDLLVQFDDARAVATLKVLRELSQRTQVLFFTHHEHLLDLALASGVATARQTHRLGAGTAAA